MGNFGFVVLSIAYILHSEENITFHLYAEAERSVLMDLETSYAIFVYNHMLLYLGYSDDEDEADKEEEEMVTADDEELEDETTDDEVELDSHASSAHNRRDSTGMDIPYPEILAMWGF